MTDHQLEILIKAQLAIMKALRQLGTRWGDGRDAILDPAIKETENLLKEINHHG